MHDLRSKIVKLGRTKTVVLITLFSIIASVVISLIMLIFLGIEIVFISMMISVVAPAIIAPAVSWYIVSLLISTHHLEERMRQLATYDMLTGAMTRHAFLEAYESCYFYAQRNKLQLAFIYIDLDDFKAINDTHGHAGGDQTLISFGEIVKEHKRKSDFFGRMGGEEFVLVLPDTGLEGAVSLANKLRCFARKTNVKYDSHDIQYTISIGISIFGPGNQVEVEELIKQADNALYRAKVQGKDCVVEFIDAAS